ncbi:lipocalin family protein [Mesoterricola sediminis]|uniref:Membrane protein n=1 Tax=Mesoterricola sediminis TaxID=2927980 RepID=A0AA48H042_9BACT|nr:lipocalin family protein [Mesoterricola sediminis]BDU77550.1 membrane protein [Mesoterricola sediminis]
MLLLAPPALVAPPPTVEHVDLARYMGDWHEIARLPNPFQRACAKTTARYILGEDLHFKVINGCLTPAGKYLEAEGRARVVDRATGARIKVSFFWPFYGDYWILALDDAYAWALVGTPDRKYLWVISRTERMDPALLDRILARATELGYDLTRLIRS